MACTQVETAGRQCNVMENDDREITIVCQGCENECEVSVAFRNGEYVCLGGNNCPTGESYALAQMNRGSKGGTALLPPTVQGRDGLATWITVNA